MSGIGRGVSFGVRGFGLGFGLTHPGDRLDRGARRAGHFADLAVLCLDERARGIVPVQAAKLGRRDLPVRSLCAVLVDHVE